MLNSAGDGNHQTASPVTSHPYFPCCCQVLSPSRDASTSTPNCFGSLDSRSYLSSCRKNRMFQALTRTACFSFTSGSCSRWTPSLPVPPMLVPIKGDSRLWSTKSTCGIRLGFTHRPHTGLVAARAQPERETPVPTLSPSSRPSNGTHSPPHLLNGRGSPPSQASPFISNDTALYFWGLLLL